VKWHGGSPVKHLRGSRVWLANEIGIVGVGRIARATLLPSHHAIDTAEILLERPLPEAQAATPHGVFGSVHRLERRQTPLCLVADDLSARCRAGDGAALYSETTHAATRTAHTRRRGRLCLLITHFEPTGGNTRRPVWP
jgi:hypothetical protein